MADVVSVETKALVGLGAGLKKLHEELTGAGSSLQKDFRGAEVFERTNPLEGVASLLESCFLTAKALGKAAKDAGEAMTKAVKDAQDKAKSEVDAAKKDVEAAKKDVETAKKGEAEALEFAEQQVKALKHVAAGDVGCPECSGSGLTKAKEGEGEGGKMKCPMCGGEGYVSKKRAADALKPGGAFRSGKLPGRGSAIRAAV